MTDWNSIQQPGTNGYTFTCSSCSHQQPLFRSYDAVIIACAKCGTIHSKDQFDKYTTLKNKITKKDTNHLPLHSKGIYNDRSLTVIGIANKCESTNSHGIWREYVLLDDLGNIHFLNCSYGNYTILTQNNFIEAEKIAENLTSDFEFQGHKFTFFSSYNYGTTNCVGEFLYDVIDVNHIKCFDFISPPFAISIERNGLRNYDAFFGQHLSRKEVARIFDKPLIEFQSHEGVGMAQPFWGGLDVARFNRFSLYFLVVLVASFFAITFSFSSNYLVYLSGDIPASTSDSTFVSSTFKIPESINTHYLTLELNSSLENEWLEAQMALINEKTSDEREFELGLEYYSGRDEGYYWSEGSSSGATHLSSVEPGTYHLKVKMSHPPFKEDKHFTLLAKTDTPISWNIGIILFPYLIFLAILNIAKNQFERVRSGDIDSFFGSSNSE